MEVGSLPANFFFNIFSQIKAEFTRPILAVQFCDRSAMLHGCIGYSGAGIDAKIAFYREIGRANAA
jgi:hypothetical protein